MRPAYAIAAVLAAVLTVGAQAATADAFQRGDVLASVGNPSVIARFAPDGTPKGALAKSAGAGPLCFDPSGEHLVAPGTGLYDSTGARLASAWASVSPSRRLHRRQGRERLPRGRSVHRGPSRAARRSASST